MSTKVITGKVRFSYVQVFNAVAIEEGQTPKYSVSIIIDKKDKATLNKVQKAIELAKEEGKHKIANKSGRVPTNIKTPLRDGDIDREDNPEYANSFFINASSVRKPQIVDDQLNPIMDMDEFYSGCYGRASLNFYAFNVNGNVGIAAGLNNLQKLEDGERLDGSTSAEADFADDEDFM